MAPDCSLLMQLSEVCSTHNALHHNTNNGDNDNNVLMDSNEHDDAIPAPCRQDLKTLFKILPKVEQEYSCNHSHNKRSQPRAADISHLCQFYNSVLRGGFCPHSNSLFRWGKGGTEILPRVYELYRHLANGNIIRNSLKSEKSHDVSFEICSTIAHLLFLVPERQLQQYIVRDLLMFVFDLACVSEGHFLQHENDDTDALQVEVVMFVQTMRELDANAQKEYAIQVWNSQELVSLQTGTFVILQIFLDLSRTKRTEEVEPVLSNHCAITEYLDTYFAACLNDTNCISQLLDSIQQTLTLTPTYSAQQDSTLWKLILRNKLAAAKVLDMIILDLDHTNFASFGVAVRTDLSTLVARAVYFHFLFHTSSPEDNAYSTLLTELVSKVILVPSDTTVEAMDSIRGAAVIFLLDCIALIAKRVNNNSTTSISVQHSEELIVLKVTVLRTIHATIFTKALHHKPSLWTITFNHCATHGIYCHLLLLLGNLQLSSIVVCICAELMNSDAVDLSGICHVTWTNFRQSKKGRIAEATAPPPIATDNVTAQLGQSPSRSGAKRKHFTFSNSPKKASRTSSTSAQPNELQLRCSPKNSTNTLPVETRHTQVTTSKSLTMNTIIPNGNMNDEKVENSPGASLARFLGGAIECSDRILSKGYDNTADPSSVLNDAISIASAVRLLVRMICRDTKAHNYQQDHATEALDMLRFLLRSLKELLQFRIPNEITSFSHDSGSTQSMLSLIIDTGIHSHFLLDPSRLSRLSDSHAGALNEALDMFSRVALDTWYASGLQVKSGTSIADSNPNTRLCCGICTKLFTGFGVDLEALRFDTEADTCSRILPCFCNLMSRTCGENYELRFWNGKKQSILPYEDKSTIGERYFQNDNAMLLFEMLPLRSRLAIIACLRPVCTNLSSKTENIKDFSGPSSTMGFIVEALDMSAIDASPKTSVTSAVTCVPILVLSLAFRLRESQARSDEANVASHVSEILNTLDPLQRIFKFTNDCVKDVENFKWWVNSRAAFVSLQRIQSICELTLRSDDDEIERPCILQNAKDLLAFLVASPTVPNRIIALAPGPKKNMRVLEDTFRSLREKLFSLQCSEHDSKVAPGVCVERWKSVAWASLYSTRSEMRQSNAHKLTVIADGSTDSPVRDKNVRLKDGAEREVLSKLGHCNENAGAKQTSGLPSLLWLVQAAFTDTNSLVRDYASKRLGLVLLGNGFSLMYALFATDLEWKVLDSPERGQWCQAQEQIVARFFGLVDRLLHTYCSVPQSQLSFTMRYAGMSEGAAVANNSTECKSRRDMPEALLFQQSAIHALSSLCSAADLESRCGVLVFEHALLRLVRFWTAIEDHREEDESFLENSFSLASSISALSFGEMSRLNQKRALRCTIARKCMDSFVPALFCEVLVPRGDDETLLNIMAPENQGRRYHLLLLFIRSFLATPRKKNQVTAFDKIDEMSIVRSRPSSVLDVLDFVDDALPSVLPALVIEEDYNALRLTTGFRMFLLSEKRRIEKLERRTDIMGTHPQELLVGNPASISHSRQRVHTKDLNERTKLLCVSPDQIEHIVPRLLMHPDRAPLVFFLKTVVKNKVPLPKMIRAARNKILKILVYKLGNSDVYSDQLISNVEVGPCNDCLVVQAIKKGALAMYQDSSIGATKSGLPRVNRMNTLDGVDAVENGARRAAGSDAASRWVSSSFMFMLVNAVQHRWKLKSPAEKIRSLRCLQAMLQFLQPIDSAQYLPQIMATVNMAISDDDNSCIDPIPIADTLHLRFLAVQALSQFVRIVIKHHVQAIGQNLTTIVVALFPVLASPRGDRLQTNEFRFIEKACKTAVELLEWLTTGELGGQLASFFSEIPFLPPSSDLDTVRTALKRNGVDFDNLLVLTATQSTQHVVSGRDSQDGSTNSESVESRQRYSSHMQAALHKRLDMLRMLLSHENISVRKVVLEYMIDLLRANRSLFHRVVEARDGSSAERFMTIVYSGGHVDGSPASNNNRTSEYKADTGLGGVTALMQALLTRCILEDDGKTRLLVAACLGEIGALDSNRIGEVSMASSESSDDSSSWRLSQPPWKSRAARYELQLLTKHLVVALKAAPTSADQHKIAFTIQELLVLLDASVQIGGSQLGDNKGDPIDIEIPLAVNDDSENTGLTTSRKNRGEMSAWLLEKLKKARVLAIIEPFWSTCFTQVDSPNLRKPPFFRPATSYFAWLSKWCGFMVKCSIDNERSRWRSFFYACRTAVRSTAGITVTEFILPLLVLDGICFGDSLDESVILQELQDVLTFSEEDRGNLNSSADESFINGMSRDERQKAVNAAFTVIDTLQYWAECETEARHRVSRSGSSKLSSSSLKRSESVSTDTASSEHWPSDESIARIEDFVQAIPLSLRANAAAAVGMHARALRNLEMAARSHVVEHMFDSTEGQQQSDKSGQECHKRKSIGSHILGGIDTGLIKHVLGHLDDCETMKAVGQESCRIELSANIIDSIKEKEAYGDWQGAIAQYERALQLDGDIPDTPSLERGLLKCLLELGQFDSVINQVNGIVHRRRANWDENSPSEKCSLSSLGHERAIPYAVEAAWRLGRWSILEQLIDEDRTPNGPFSRLDVEGLYQLSVGRAMLGLRKRSSSMVTNAVTEARQTLMTTMSSFARESYSRSYPHLLRLHCLREIENASDFLCCSNKDAPEFSAIAEAAKSLLPEGWAWDGRLDTTSSMGSATIINVRLALARLGGDSSLEGSLFLTIGKRARKSDLSHVAENSLAQAEAAFLRLRSPRDGALQSFHLDGLLTSVQMQLAKIKHGAGESSSALRILGQDEIHGFVDKDDASLRVHVSKVEFQKCALLGIATEVEESDSVTRFARRLFQSTQWMAEGGLKGGAEVMNRFRVVQKLSPGWEKSYFYFAKYVDSLLKCRVEALASQPSQNAVDDDALRATIILNDQSCQKYLLLAIQQYGQALKISQKHVYHALPRLLTLWFDFTAINSDELESPAKEKKRASNDTDPRARIFNNQSQANQQMAQLLRLIPPQSFYTTMPQLISRVAHRDSDTGQVVVAILKRVLMKFPSQAMWTLAWLRNSSDKERSDIGEDIFKGAMRSLQKNKDMKMHDLLVASKSLFKYLIDLAKYQPKESNARSFNVRAWKGEVELMEFIPPVQAALSIPPTSIGRTSTREVFPALVPRMRTFAPQVTVMASKARPKKLKVFVLPARQLRSRRVSSSSNGSVAGRPHSDDIGEMHFLLKQEAKGDLRKDARVQDLNNVINRLMASSNSSSTGDASRQRRRLHLRTFAVTCLSEDCGILEWVPNTESLRNLVGKSYNPQAAPFSIRRRGKRMSNFGDINLRKSYEKCQEVYKTKGDFIKAASMFEDLCLKQNPPLLYWWFVQNFLEPHAWYEARTRFTLSTAAWSAIGHVIGLGDRHSENILVDTSTGDCVHVDFDCIFDKGLNLPQPEVVPFRLTPNIIDVFGPTGADGTYTGSLKTAMSTLRDNRDTLLSVLEPFLKDPVIDWKRQRSSQQKTRNSASRDSTQAKRSIEIIDGRLKGIYNLRNPNMKKFRRTDGGSTGQDDEMTHLIPLSVDGQVHKMITEATSHENLVQLYVGWMPWI